ncbi:Ionotropic receptor 101 [Frankliniella occidentalis]|nr:Ionotropic receptor 101 [Frankliniella occidentalis]
MAVLVHLGLLIGVLCWTGVHAALHPVDTPAAPEAECVASFISSIMPPDNSCLVVHGDARLVGPLLRNLQDLDRGRLTFVMDPRYIPTHTRVRIESTTLAVIAAENPANLSTLAFRDTGLFFSYSGLVVWVRARSLEDALHDPVGLSSWFWICNKNVHLLLTTPNGTTIQYVPDVGGSCVVTWSDLKMREVRRCEPGRRQGWQGQPSRPRLCSRWKSPETGKTTPKFLSVRPPHYRQFDVPAAYDEPYHLAVSTLTTAVSRWLRTPIELSWESNNSVVFAQITNCSLNAAFLNYPVKVRNVSHIEFDSFFMSPTIVVVPGGSVMRLNVLRAVTAEFSAELWIATALALLFMTAAMVVAWTTLGRPPLSALAAATLQTLAPLLAQPPPGRTAHRPLSAVWLLMSVVLAAAYQGLLLRELTAPPGEINSLEQLEQSGLDIYAEETIQLQDSLESRLSQSLNTKIQYYNPMADYMTALQRVVEGRNSALICRQHVMTTFILSRLSNRIHVFTLPNSTNLLASVISTKGSPFMKPLHSALSWFSASGLLKYYLTMADFHLTLNSASKDTASKLNRPLSLGQLQPAFCLLAAGYVLSAVVFVLEVLCYKWSRRHAPPVPVFLH